MTNFTTHLLDRKPVAAGTMEFILKKPVGLQFKAGQNADYTLTNPPETDAEGNKRTFSFVSAPSEDQIMFATRMRDTAFKRSMKEIPIGTEMKVEGPYGDMTLHNNASRPAVFLAGGIGITPFHSMIKDAVEKKLPHQIYLFYSNRRPEDAAFLQKLIGWQKQNPNYHFVGTMTEMEKSTQRWDGERGYINKAMLEKYLKNLSGPVYYIAGPPGLVASMKNMLNQAGINDDDIKTEEFSGY